MRACFPGAVWVSWGHETSPTPPRPWRATLASGRRATGSPWSLGGARGADRLAGQNALVEGGLSVWVLADAMRRVAAEPALRASILADRLTLCSPYHPDASFTAGAAMGRNKLIYALAERTVVVASDLDKGGTWSGAKEALKKRYGQVLVWRGNGEGSGNAGLQVLGAIPFTEVSDLAAIAQRESAPSEPQDSVPDDPEQLTLEL